MMAKQSLTPIDLVGNTSKEVLKEEFIGKPLSCLRTPALVIDRAIFARNCLKMHETALEWKARFRAHVKSHKTAEGTKMQLCTSAAQTHAIIVSTLMEAWQVARSGLVEEGIVKDILYGLPIAINRMEDISVLRKELRKYGAELRLHIDHPDQIEALETFEKPQSDSQRWSAFLKLDCGDKRAGVTVESSSFEALLHRFLESSVVSLYGFYCHQGSSYSSTSLDEASGFLWQELEAANTAAGKALAILKDSPGNSIHADPFILSVGSTPTTHAAASALHLNPKLNGILELHAGNYPLLDLQQINTSLVDAKRVSQRVLATVVSYYPGRGVDGSDEALVDAGAIAMSKDRGPIEGFGQVIGKRWKLGRVSQEHGILVRDSSIPAGTYEGEDELKIGEQVQIVGQHACLICAAYPWFYVCDSSSSEPDTVVDVWVPWKGW